MANLTGTARANYVQAMFGRIAHRYDLMNRVMTGGMDQRWRKLLLSKAALQPGDWLLDLGTGTGDIAIEARRTGAQVVAGDFTLEMMQVGQTRPNTEHVRWLGSDTLNLPFTHAQFDAVVSGFLLRNVGNLPRALAEQYRVLKPGGRIVILDSTPPDGAPLAPFIRFYERQVVPRLGRLIVGDAEAYNYLPNSIENFVSAEGLAEQMQMAGFTQVGFRRLMFGAVAMHWGQRPTH